MLCPALNDHLVIAGELELWAKEAAGIRIAQDASLRRHGGDIEPCPAGEERPHQRPDAKDQNVLQREPVGVGRQFVPQPLHVEASSTKKGPRQILLSGLRWTVPPVRSIRRMAPP